MKFLNIKNLLLIVFLAITATNYAQHRPNYNVVAPDNPTPGTPTPGTPILPDEPVRPIDPDFEDEADRLLDPDFKPVKVTAKKRVLKSGNCPTNCF